jgi:hypothetical protein
MEESSVVYITMQDKSSSSSSSSRRRRELAGQNNCCIFGKREMGQKERAEKAQRNSFSTHLTSKEREKAAEEEYDAGKTEFACEKQRETRAQRSQTFHQSWLLERRDTKVCSLYRVRAKRRMANIHRPGLD